MPSWRLAEFTGFSSLGARKALADEGPRMFGQDAENSTKTEVSATRPFDRCDSLRVAVGAAQWLEGFAYINV